MSQVKSILFVCTGNSCRSIMAEGLMKKYLKALKKGSISVRSAGVNALEGYLPTDDTVEVMKKEDVDVSGFRSKRVTENLIRESDLILVMERVHRDFIIRMTPEAAPKTHLLKEFCAKNERNYPENTDIPDPIGKPREFYELSVAIIKDQVKRIAECV